MKGQNSYPRYLSTEFEFDAQTQLQIPVLVQNHQFCAFSSILSIFGLRFRALIGIMSLFVALKTLHIFEVVDPRTWTSRFLKSPRDALAGKVLSLPFLMRYVRTHAFDERIPEDEGYIEQRYNLRDRRGYILYGDEFYVHAIVLSNLSRLKSIKEHGVEAVESILREMSQMHHE